MRTKEPRTPTLDIGATPNEVAATLRACDIFGRRYSARYYNPIVQYVYRRHPANRCLHIIRFNDGKYPDLETDEWP